MAEEVGKGKVSIEADTDGLGKSIASGVDKESGFITKAFGGVGKIAGTAFKAAAVGVAAGVVAAGALAKSSIDAASDLAESMSKVEVVFGDASAEVVAWSKTSATAFGQSQQSALEAAGTYGNLFQAFGIGQKPAQEMSQTLVELAADLASFNNTSVDEALDSLRSGLSGETEPLKKYGVAINDVRLKEQALAMGLISSTKDALTPAAKAQATYALVLQDTALAQGDFARTSDGLANKQRILAAKFTDLKAKLGAVLLPAMLAVVAFVVDRVFPALEALGPKLVDAFNSPQVQGAIRMFQRVAAAVVDWIVSNWPSIRDTVVDVAAGVVDAVRGIIDVVTNIVTYLADNEYILAGVATVIAGVLVAGIVSWTVATWAQVTAQWALAAAWIATNAPMIAFIAVLALLVAGVVYAYQNWEWFRNVVDGVRAWMVDTLWPAMQAVFGWLRDNVPPIIQAVAGFITGTLWPALQSVWSFMVEYLFPIFQAVWGWLRDNVPTIIGAVVAAIGTLWGWLQTLWDRSEGLRAFLVGAFKASWDVTKTAVDGISTAVSALWGWLQTLWDRAEPVRAFLAGAFWLAVTTVGTAFDAISTAVSAVWSWFQTLWDKGVEVAGYLEGAFSTALGVAEGAWGTLQGAVEGVVGAIQWVIDKAKTAADWIGKVAAQASKIPGVGGSKALFEDFPIPAGNATGGGMKRFGTYLVGERGPEIVKLGSVAGYTTPNHRLRGDLATLADDRPTRGDGPLVEFTGPVMLSDQLDVDAVASTISFMVEAA